MQVCSNAAASTALTTQVAQVLKELLQALPDVEVIANEGLECVVWWCCRYVPCVWEKGVVLFEDSFIIAQLLLFVRKMWGNVF